MSVKSRPPAQLLARSSVCQPSADRGASLGGFPVRFYSRRREQDNAVALQSDPGRATKDFGRQDAFNFHQALVYTDKESIDTDES